MNIYKARELQKVLFKQSNSEYKFMKINIMNEKLCYFVGHRTCDTMPIEMTTDDAFRIIADSKEGVHYLVDVMTESRLRRANTPIRSPAGVYIIEYVEVD